MLKLNSIGALTLAAPSQSGRPAYISAASGLVRVDRTLYVVADDENYLGIFQDDLTSEGTLRRLFAGELPLGRDARKAVKPDLEILTYLPANHQYPNGALLALGSGSTDHRRRAAIIAFDGNSHLVDNVETLDLSANYNQIAQRVPDLNIEGAIIAGEDIVLFQRGNNVSHNATIRCRADMFLSEAHDDMRPLNFLLRRYDVGEIEGVPLGFTDASSLDDGTIVFCAAAEDTSNAYNDGVCAGSAIGLINRDGQLSKVMTVDQRVKLEGICATVSDNVIHLLAVTDADDVAVPAELYSATLSL